jgi:fructose-bisphosphate aldolase class II
LWLFASYERDAAILPEDERQIMVFMARFSFMPRLNCVARSLPSSLSTDPLRKVDALAIAMGTSHGAYKFSRKPDGEVLAMNVIEQIHKKLPNVHLVMHGSSSVPQDLQDLINQFGGQMKPTWGVPVEEIQRGIRHGVRKINIDTDNRMAITGQIRRVLQENPGEFDPRKYLKPALEAMSKICRERLEQFGTAGQASKIGKIRPLSEMAKLYAAGKLDPTFS